MAHLPKPQAHRKEQANWGCALRTALRVSGLTGLPTHSAPLSVPEQRAVYSRYRNPHVSAPSQPSPVASLPLGRPGCSFCLLASAQPIQSWLLQSLGRSRSHRWDISLSLLSTCLCVTLSNKYKEKRNPQNQTLIIKTVWSKRDMA